MNINIDKTKVMAIADNNTMKIEVENKEIQQVNQFQYLAITIAPSEKQEVEINKKVD